MSKNQLTSANAIRLRRQAESRLRERRNTITPPSTISETQRMLLELQTHQTELETQNTLLKETAERIESSLKKYTDLYDLSPSGYVSLDEHGAILEGNQAISTLLGVKRNRLLKQRLQDFIAPESREYFILFLKRVFAKPGKHTAEVCFINKDGTSSWADIQAVAADPLQESDRWCRVTVSEITPPNRRAANEDLRQEITRRCAAEIALAKIESRQRLLLEQADKMKNQMSRLSRLILRAQEEERRRISRELHDEVLQTLTGINFHLASLNNEAKLAPIHLRRKIVHAQGLVEESVNAIHRFARELRPLILDDLGLIPALHCYIADFRKRTAIRVLFRSFPEVENLSADHRTVLYRVVQAALANVAEHANASRVKLDIRCDKETLSMVIQNDGKSFNVERTLNSKNYKRLGLLGMRERVEMVGGRFFIESTPDLGTSIQVEIPLLDGVEVE
jgi:PAS domain S-box-containing protein